MRVYQFRHIRAVDGEDIAPAAESACRLGRSRGRGPRAFGSLGDTHEPPSSRDQGRRPLTAVTRVRIPLAVLKVPVVERRQREGRVDLRGADDPGPPRLALGGAPCASGCRRAGWPRRRAPAERRVRRMSAVWSGSSCGSMRSSSWRLAGAPIWPLSCSMRTEQALSDGLLASKRPEVARRALIVSRRAGRFYGTLRAATMAGKPEHPALKGDILTAARRAVHHVDRHRGALRVSAQGALAGTGCAPMSAPRPASKVSRWCVRSRRQRDARKGSPSCFHTRAPC